MPGLGLDGALCAVASALHSVARALHACPSTHLLDSSNASSTQASISSFHTGGLGRSIAYSASSTLPSWYELLMSSTNPVSVSLRSSSTGSHQ
eukprot:3130360-Pleurochrysis_carterae.AAC.3